MRLSESLTRRLEGGFFRPSSGGWCQCGGVTRSPFSKFLITKVDFNQEAFIPIIGLYNFTAKMEELIEKEQFTPVTLCYPLYAGKKEEKRTADSILSAICCVSGGTRLNKISTSKGEVYYGGNGVILDKNKHPLLVAGYKASMNWDMKIWEVNGLVCKVSPEVFINKDILCKAIVSKVIPFFTTNSISVQLPVYQTAIRHKRRGTYPPITIEVGYFDEWFTQPALPGPMESFNDSIWKTLYRSIKDLKCQ